MKRFFHAFVLGLCGAYLLSAPTQSQTVIVPLTYESTGTVLELAPDLSQINIDGRVMAVDSEVSIHNLVNSDPVAGLKVGSEVGYESIQIGGGEYVVHEIWVLSSP